MGFPPELFDPKDAESFHCAVCKDVVQDAVTIRDPEEQTNSVSSAAPMPPIDAECGHIFCRTCILPFHDEAQRMNALMHHNEEEFIERYPGVAMLENGSFRVFRVSCPACRAVPSLVNRPFMDMSAINRIVKQCRPRLSTDTNLDKTYKQPLQAMLAIHLNGQECKTIADLPDLNFTCPRCNAAVFGDILQHYNCDCDKRQGVQPVPEPCHFQAVPRFHVDFLRQFAAVRVSLDIYAVLKQLDYTLSGTDDYFRVTARRSQDASRPSSVEVRIDPLRSDWEYPRAVFFPRIVEADGTCWLSDIQLEVGAVGFRLDLNGNARFLPGCELVMYYSMLSPEPPEAIRRRAVEAAREEMEAKFKAEMAKARVELEFEMKVREELKCLWEGSEPDADDDEDAERSASRTGSPAADSDREREYYGGRECDSDSDGAWNAKDGDKPKRKRKRERGSGCGGWHRRVVVVKRGGNKAAKNRVVSFRPPIPPSLPSASASCKSSGDVVVIDGDSEDTTTMPAEAASSSTLPAGPRRGE